MAFPSLKLVNGAEVFDLNEPTGAGNPSGLKTRLIGEVNLGTPGKEIRTISTDRPGALLARKRDDVAVMSFQVDVSAPDGSVNTLRSGGGELQRILDAGGDAGWEIQWQPRADTEIRFYDFLTSQETPNLFGDKTAMMTVIKQERNVTSFLVEILRQPYTRGPEIDSDTNKTKNSLFIHEGVTGGRPRDWDWASALDISSESIDAATEAYKFDIATTATRLLQQETPAGSAAQGEIWTFYFYGFVTPGEDVRGVASIQFLDSAGVTLATHDGPITSFETIRPNMSEVSEAISVTTPAAPANMDHIRVSVSISSTTATARTVFLIGAQLEKSSAPSKLVVATETQTNEVTENTDGYPSVAPVFIHGDAPAPVSFRFATGTDQSKSPIVALRSRSLVGDKRLLDYLKTTHFAQAEDGTAVVDTALITAATEPDFSPGSGNVGMETTFATNANMVDRVQLRLNTLLESRRGAFDVYVRCLQTLAGEVRLQLWWSLSFFFSAPEPEIVLHDHGFPQFRRLGRIFVPRENPFGELALFLQARRLSGSTALRWDYVTFVAVDEQAAEIGRTGEQDPTFSSDSINTVPDKDLVFVSDASGNLLRIAKRLGPLPFDVSPGLAMIFRHHKNFQNSTDGRIQDTSEDISVDKTMHHAYSPRYYQ